MLTINGTYQLEGRSEAYPAKLVMHETGQVIIRHSDTNNFLAESWPENYRYGDVIPGLPVDLIFEHGSVFIPEDRQFRWPNLTAKHRLAEWLESHWITVLSSVVIVPLFLWAMVNHVLPIAAHSAVSFLPSSISKSMGDQTLYILDKTYLDPTELSAKQQNQVEAIWNNIVTTLELPANQYQLHFRKFSMGANALALPNGSIIVTDDIVTLMKNNKNALTAVLLHEIGHVEHQHSLKMIAQTTATTMLFAMMFGDIEGAGELILGAGTGLLQSAFSRNMEREADEYSHKHLPKLGISSTAFADAMALLESSYSSSNKASDENPEEASVNSNYKDTPQNEMSNIHHWLQYLSSHPDTQERINTARKKGGEENDTL